MKHLLKGAAAVAIAVVAASQGAAQLTDLHIAVLNFDETLAARLIDEKGADMNAKTDNGWTPLHYAA